MANAADRPLSKGSILALLEHSDRAVIRACMALYERQTASKQASHSTQVENGIGFNAADAGMLSAIAKKGAKGQAIAPLALQEARHRVMKYAGQLLEIAMENQLNQLMAEGREGKEQ